MMYLARSSVSRAPWYWRGVSFDLPGKKKRVGNPDTSTCVPSKTTAETRMGEDDEKQKDE